ncbi:histone H1-like [Octopus sinensis]|uniref:Histone H1-like n=1 Tax=Octopus sinensis TaxID=2607531 RepID=A0A6P7TIG1_9MOLL|nr:histone H1-like [Octopus sinensis]
MTEKAAKKKVPPKHPKFKEMIKAAITALKERNGSSRASIAKHILANNNVENNTQFLSNLRLALRHGVDGGSLIQTKGSGASGSFKVAKSDKAKKPAKPKGAAKKKVAAKKKPSGKKGAAAKKAKATKTAKPKGAKSPAKKKPAAKKTPKKAPAKKAPAKKPVAKKTKPAKKAAAKK